MLDDLQVMVWVQKASKAVAGDVPDVQVSAI